jgi:hypothetical protein
MIIIELIVLVFISYLIFKPSIDVVDDGFIIWYNWNKKRKYTKFWL